MTLIGGNGQGFFQNLDDQTKTWLHEAFADRPFCINFPGGAEANIATPSTLLKGWGLTEEIIQARFGGGQTDEDGNGLDKWMEKLRQQNLKSRSFLYDLQDLSNEFPNLEVVWKANIVTGSLEDAIEAFETVRNFTGCKRVVLGNEVYSKGNFNFSFSSFLEKAHPFLAWIKETYPDVKVAIPYAPNIARKEHNDWNTSISNYLGNYDAVDVHIYLTADELPDAFNSYPSIKIDYHPLEEYPVLDDCFNTFANEYFANDTWERVIDDVAGKIPYKELWCTEFNIKPSNYFCNTIAGGAYLFRKLMSQEYFDVLCVHNLVSPDIYGCISRTDDIDYDQTTPNTRRVGYYALKFASEAMAYSFQELYDGADSTLGVTCFWYDNVGDYDPTYDIYADEGVITPPKESFINGEHIYDSLGKAGYMSKVTEIFDPRMNIEIENLKEFEVSGQEIVSINGGRGFGYVVIQTIPKPKPEPQCRKHWWQFWRRKCTEKAYRYEPAT